MSNLLGQGNTFPLTTARYGVAISWDHGKAETVDVDLQALAVDTTGHVIDAVFYNNLKALCAMTHSGDERTGEKSGHDEVIWVNFSRLPMHVKMLVFVVAAHKGGHLRDAKNGKIHILENSSDNEVAAFLMEPSHEEVDVVATMLRNDTDNWSLTVIDEAAQDGRHFMDILEPTIGNIVRKIIPGAPTKLELSFSMDKGTVVDLPQTSKGKVIKVGLGWDTHGGNVDLDVSAVLFDINGKEYDAIFFSKLQGSGVQHSGDNTTGKGSGDDETITVTLDLVPDRVQQIFFIVNIYTRGRTFSEVSNPYCRVLDSGGIELARYRLREAGDTNGLIIARIVREDGCDRWGFQAIGTFCNGRTWKDSLSDMALLFRRAPHEGFEESFEVGELAEVSIIEGRYAGNWLKCTILGAGSSDGTYKIHILPTTNYDNAGGFSDTDVDDISKDYLRKAGGYSQKRRPGSCGLECTQNSCAIA